MKVILVLFALLGASYAVPHHRQSRSLRDDMDALEAMIPFEKIKEIYMKYRDDPDIVQFIDYLKSPDFAAAADIITDIPEVQDLVAYFERKGVNVVEYFNMYADLLYLPPGSTTGESRTWLDMINEIIAVLPLEDITDKLNTSVDFSKLFELMQTFDYKKIYDDALEHPEIVDILNRLNAVGLDTIIWGAIKFVLGLE